MYFWLRWVFVAVQGLSLVAASGVDSLLWCAGFSLWWLLLLQSMGSRGAGFSSCGTWAQQLWHMGLVAPRHVGSSQTRDWTCVPCIGRWILNHCATGEVPNGPCFLRKHCPAEQSCLDNTQPKPDVWCPRSALPVGPVSPTFMFSLAPQCCCSMDQWLVICPRAKSEATAVKWDGSTCLEGWGSWPSPESLQALGSLRGLCSWFSPPVTYFLHISHGFILHFFQVFIQMPFHEIFDEYSI